MQRNKWEETNKQINKSIFQKIFKDYTMPVKIVTMGVAMAMYRRISITGSLCGRLENGHLGKFSASNQPLAFAEEKQTRDFQQKMKHWKTFQKSEDPKDPNESNASQH